MLRAGIGPFELLDDLGGTLAGLSGGALRSLSFLWCLPAKISLINNWNQTKMFAKNFFFFFKQNVIHWDDECNDDDEADVDCCFIWWWLDEDEDDLWWLDDRCWDPELCKSLCKWEEKETKSDLVHFAWWGDTYRSSVMG